MNIVFHKYSLFFSLNREVNQPFFFTVQLSWTINWPLIQEIKLYYKLSINISYSCT